MNAFMEKIFNMVSFLLLLVPPILIRYFPRTLFYK